MEPLWAEETTFKRLTTFIIPSVCLTLFQVCKCMSLCNYVFIWNQVKDLTRNECFLHGGHSESSDWILEWGVGRGENKNIVFFPCPEDTCNCNFKVQYNRLNNVQPKSKHFSYNFIWHRLKDNSGAKWIFGLITHCYLVNRFLRFVFMIAECK